MGWVYTWIMGVRHLSPGISRVVGCLGSMEKDSRVLESSFCSVPRVLQYQFCVSWSWENFNTQLASSGNSVNSAPVCVCMETGTLSTLGCKSCGCLTLSRAGWRPHVEAEAASFDGVHVACSENLPKTGVQDTPNADTPKLQVNVSVENTHEYYSISLLQERVKTPWDPVNGPSYWSQGIRCGWIFVYLYSYPIWESLGCCCIRHHTKMKQKCGLSSLLLKNNIIFSVIYRVSEQQGRKGRDSFGSLILTTTHNTTQRERGNLLKKYFNKFLLQKLITWAWFYPPGNFDYCLMKQSTCSVIP